MSVLHSCLCIDLKNPQLKLLLLHEKIQLVQDSQLYQIKLKISVYYNGESLEGFEHIYECPVNKKKIGIQKEKQVNLDQYVNFILKSNLSLSSNQEFCQHSYILFEIFTINTKNKESIQKEREQTISFNELKNQMLLEKNLKFFKETDQIYSQVTKFDLQLQTQLIYNQKKFLAETVQESQVLKDAVYDFNNNYKKILQKQKKQQNQQKQTNSSENSQVQESTKETFQTESEAQFNPTQIFYNLFKEDYNKRSTLKSQRFSYQPKSYQNFDSTFQSNNKISALDFQESYSFQNVYMVKEESDYEQDFEESNEKIKEEEEEDNNNEEYKSELFLNYNTFKPQQKINLNLDLKNDQDDLLNSDGIKQDNEDFSTPILLQYDYYSSDNNTSPIFIKKVNPSSDYIEK